MKTLYTELELKQTKHKEKLPLECQECHKIFYRTKNVILRKDHTPNANSFCSRKCAAIRHLKQVFVECGYCKKPFSKRASVIGKGKYKVNFCSMSCSGKYFQESAGFVNL